MRSVTTAVNNSVFRDLPSVDELLRSDTGREIVVTAGPGHTAALVRQAIESIREGIENVGESSKDELLKRSEEALGKLWISEKNAGIKRVINATGVIIHTNLGRAPLSDNARQAMVDAAGYCSLEYDLESGQRGRRGERTEELLIELTGAEDALVVNNCAAAAFFALSVFAAGGEVIISRGEMVEIGGDFRIPDVLETSGARLREIGTTNRTKLADYEKAIAKDTRVLLRVHPSNYRIVGFTATPSINELADLAKKHNILLYEDIGSGAIVDLSEYGLNEPVVSESIAAGADLVSFSGDKLLGGPQAGIIAGKRDLVERLRKHPLQRALRVDKKTFAALESTLESYLRGTQFEDIPVLRQLSTTAETLKTRAAAFAEALKPSNEFEVNISDGESVIGGGAAPDVHPKTTLISIKHNTLSAEDLDRKLRMSTPPVVGRIEKNSLLLDLRTVSEADEPELLSILKHL